MHIKVNVCLVLVDAGSRYELDYISGVSHFLQRLAFQVSYINYTCGGPDL